MDERGETRRQNSDQQRAKAAWDNIHSIKEKLGEKEQKEYRSLARGLNAMVQINGLGQTLGFLHAKGGAKKQENKENAHYYLLSHLTSWMHSRFTETIAEVTVEQNEGLLDWIIIVASSTDYRRATTECLAFGSWLNRFAEAELKGEV